MSGFDVDESVLLQHTIWTGATGTPSLTQGYVPTTGPVHSGTGGLYSIYLAAGSG